MTARRSAMVIVATDAVSTLRPFEVSDCEIGVEDVPSTGSSMCQAANEVERGIGRAEATGAEDARKATGARHVSGNGILWDITWLRDAAVS